MRRSVENIDKRHARTLRREMRDKGRADAGRPAADEHHDHRFQKKLAEDTIADVEASGLWPGEVVTEVTLLGSPGTSTATDRQARVTRYEYATGLTITTVVDLNASQVLDVRVEANRPTPLGGDEVQRAIVLAALRSSGMNVGN